MAASATIALRNEPPVSTGLGPPLRRDHLHGQPPGLVGALAAGGCPAPASRPCPGSVMPSASASSPIVEAVPIVLQWPRLRIIDDSERRNSCLGQRARADLLAEPPHVRAAAQRLRRGTCRSASGRPGTTTAGRSTEAAAISSDGMVLSQPPSSTTPSTGLARSISSMAIAAMLRHSIAVGRTQRLAQRHHRQVQRDAARLPDALLDALGDLVRWELHGVRSEAVLAIAMCGRPSKACAGRPAPHPGPVDVAVAVGARRTTARCAARSSLSLLPGQVALTRRSAHDVIGAGERPAMRASSSPGPGRPRSPRSTPPVAGPGQVVVDVERAGVCGTDVEFFTGEMAYLGRATPATRCASGTSGAAPSPPSARASTRPGSAAGSPATPCSAAATAAAAGAAASTCASDRFEIGIRGGWPGALAEQLPCPASALHAAAGRLDAAAGAMVEPGGNALRAVRAAGRCAPGDRLLVLGAGHDRPAGRAVRPRPGRRGAPAGPVGARRCGSPGRSASAGVDAGHVCRRLPSTRSSTPPPASGCRRWPPSWSSRAGGWSTSAWRPSPA